MFPTYRFVVSGSPTSKDPPPPPPSLLVLASAARLAGLRQGPVLELSHKLFNVTLLGATKLHLLFFPRMLLFRENIQHARPWRIAGRDRHIPVLVAPHAGPAMDGKPRTKMTWASDCTPRPVRHFESPASRRRYLHVRSCRGGVARPVRPSGKGVPCGVGLGPALRCGARRACLLFCGAWRLPPSESSASNDAQKSSKIFAASSSSCLRRASACSGHSHSLPKGAKGRDLPVLWCRPHTDCRPVFQGFMIS